MQLEQEISLWVSGSKAPALISTPPRQIIMITIHISKPNLTQIPTNNRIPTAISQDARPFKSYDHYDQTNPQQTPPQASLTHSADSTTPLPPLFYPLATQLSLPLLVLPPTTILHRTTHLQIIHQITAYPKQDTPLAPDAHLLGMRTIAHHYIDIDLSRLPVKHLAESGMQTEITTKPFTISLQISCATTSPQSSQKLSTTSTRNAPRSNSK